MSVQYHSPTRLSDALAILAAHQPTPLAGGTDIYPAWAHGAAPRQLLDVTKIAEFSGGIEEREAGWFIHPLTTWTQIVRAKLPSCFAALQHAAAEIGGRQVQNRATVVGNICNASPAADGTVALMSLNAAVHLASAQGVRSVPLDVFVTGNRATLKQPDELVTGIAIPRWGDDTRSAFRKLGARRYLVISIAMVAVTLEIEADAVRRAAVSVGSCSARAVRAASIENLLQGRKLSQISSEAIRQMRIAEIAPIGDVRSTAEYRAHAAPLLIAEAVEHCLAGVSG